MFSISLQHENPTIFRVSQWGNLKTVSTFYLLYRSIISIPNEMIIYFAFGLFCRIVLGTFFTATYFTVWIKDHHYNVFWLIYLTNQVSNLKESCAHPKYTYL